MVAEQFIPTRLVTWSRIIKFYVIFRPVLHHYHFDFKLHTSTMFLTARCTQFYVVNLLRMFRLTPYVIAWIISIFDVVLSLHLNTLYSYHTCLFNIFHSWVTYFMVILKGKILWATSHNMYRVPMEAGVILGYGLYKRDRQLYQLICFPCTLRS